MGKTTLKSSKSEVKSKKNAKPGKTLSTHSAKKNAKVVLKKSTHSKNDKKSEGKAMSSKGSIAKKPLTKGDKKGKESSSKASTKSQSPIKSAEKKGSVSSKDSIKSLGVHKVAEKKGAESKKTAEAHKESDKPHLNKKNTSEKETTEKWGAKSSTPAKKKSGEKKEEFAVEDDLVGESDDFISDELSEYQSELENAEDDEDEKEVVVEESSSTLIVAVTPSSLAHNKDKSDDIVLTDAEGRRYCRVKDCDQVETVDAYCRYHYLLLWKRIQIRKKILSDGKLERYVEELTSRYPDKFLEVIRRDLRTEKDFLSAIQEMEIDESSSDNDFEDESSNFIDEVRGASADGLVEDDEY